MHRPRAVPLVLAILLALLGAACGSTNHAGTVSATSAPDDTSAPGSGPDETLAPGATGTTGAQATTGGAPRASGVANASVPEASVPLNERVTAPIEIGIVRTAVSNAKAFGVDPSTFQTVSEDKVDEALVKAFNAEGGIAGRKIVPVYADTDTATSRWEADFAAACASFTQDHHVAAVLGYVFDFQSALEDCLAKNHIPHLSTTFNVPDADTMKRYPLLEALANPRVERRSIAKIDGAMRNGILKTTSRFGVMKDACPSTTRSWDKTVLPAIKARKLNLADVETFTCAGGASDNGTAVQQLQNAILKFRSNRVDTVMIHGVSEGPGLLLFSQEANSQGWYPTYIVSSLANAAVLKDQIPEKQAMHMHGYGWIPAQDVPPSKYPPLTSSAKRCLALAKKGGGIVPSTAADYSFVFSTCEALLVYERALKVTLGHTDGTHVIGAIDAFGTSFSSSINLDGATRFSRSVHDAPSHLRHFAYDTACNCFTYRGAVHPIPEV